MRNKESFPVQSENIEYNREKKQKIGRRFRDLFSKRGEVGETLHSDYYLLSENVNPFDTPFGRPRSKSKKDINEAQKWWNNVCASWDDEDQPKLPYELGKAIENIANDQDYFFGIHRSSSIDGEEFESDEILHSILTEGLVNLGDASSGAIYKDPPVSKTVSACPDMLHTIMNLKSPYKFSTGAILVAIPKEFVDRSGNINEGMENKVYNHSEIGNSYLKPEFILGFVQNLGKGTTMKFESRNQILEAYNDKHNGIDR